MYEMIHVLAGVRRASGHPDTIEVRPYFTEYGLKKLEGEIITEYGPVRFEYTCGEGVHGTLTLPEGMHGTAYLRGEEAVSLMPGTNTF